MTSSDLTVIPCRKTIEFDPPYESLPMASLKKGLLKANKTRELNIQPFEKESSSLENVHYEKKG